MSPSVVGSLLAAGVKRVSDMSVNAWDLVPLSPFNLSRHAGVLEPTEARPLGVVVILRKEPGQNQSERPRLRRTESSYDRCAQRKRSGETWPG